MAHPSLTGQGFLSSQAGADSPESHELSAINGPLLSALPEPKHGICVFIVCGRGEFSPFFARRSVTSLLHLSGKQLMENPWLFAGGAAAMGLLATGWEYVRSAYQQVSGRLIVRISTNGYQSDALLLYFNEVFRASKFGPRSYAGWLLHVRPTRRTQLVAMEVVGGGGRLYWKGWRPLWINKSNSAGGGEVEEGVTGRDDYRTNELNLTFVRGMFDADQLVLDACDFYNARMMTVDAESEQRRHYIRHVHGTAGKHLATRGRGRSDYSATAGDTRSCMHHRPLGWEMSELGFQADQDQSSIEQLALGDEALDLVHEARFWKQNEQWYRDRLVPWRRGWLLHGEPGTGKTAMIRAVAEDLDLPVFVYDLGTLRNEELQTAWSNMHCEVPCMAVIEDIDAVFNKREHIVGKDSSLTFDCLLNCLDGIERSNGLFLVVTTNRLDHIDEALGRPNGSNASTRPGRIDRTLYCGPMNELARRKMAIRVLQDSPDIVESVVAQGDGDTAAQFQERCASIALGLLWAERESKVVMPTVAGLDEPETVGCLQSR